MIFAAKKTGDKLFILAAGGTGGHFFPALALARELQGRGRKICVMTDARARKYGEQLDGLAVKQTHAATIFAGGVIARLIAPIKIIFGILQSGFSYIMERPDMVIGFGGYPAFAPLVAARLLGIPIAIHEQNAILGRANRALVRLGARIAISYPGTKFIPAHKRGYAVVTGNPLREKVLEAAQIAYDPPIAHEKFNLLVFGGSQGARVFSEVLPKAIAALPEDKRKSLRLVQQCRKSELKECLNTYSQMGVDTELRDFFDDMPQRIAQSHLIIARSGASTICELAAIGRPSILVPLPAALDNDQMMNAVHLSNYRAAFLVAQRLFTPTKLSELLGELMDNPARLTNMAAVARGRGVLNATAKLADFCELQAGVMPPTTTQKEELAI